LTNREAAAAREPVEHLPYRHVGDQREQESAFSYNGSVLMHLAVQEEFPLPVAEARKNEGSTLCARSSRPGPTTLLLQ
jgi:hypothetical protein